MKFVLFAVFLCIYACIHDELMQAPEVCQEMGGQPRSAMFGEETRVV